MDKKVSESRRKVNDSVVTYLRSRGMPGVELPPDLHRELVRLLEEERSEQVEPLPDRDSRETRSAGEKHRYDMLTFEMYLAAWVTTSGICDRPRRKQVARRRPSPAQ